jgi:UPF0716 protein FxsA
MWKRLLALLLLIPLVDGLLLVFVAGMVGWEVTVALVVLTALVGTLLVRAEGRHTIRELQAEIGRGEIPTDRIVDGGFLLVAGAFLLTPGLVTDALGFLLTLPPTRYVFRVAAKKWVIMPYVDKQTGGFASGNVYTFGFPNPGDLGGSGSDSGGFGPGGGSGSAGGDAADDTYRMDDDAYDVDFDEDDEKKGNP